MSLHPGKLHLQNREPRDAARPAQRQPQRQLDRGDRRLLWQPHHLKSTNQKKSYWAKWVNRYRISPINEESLVSQIRYNKKKRCLDISDNKIDCEDSEDVIKILEAMPCLKVLYMFGNPVVSKIKSYRKTLIARLPLLKF